MGDCKEKAINIFPTLTQSGTTSNTNNMCLDGGHNKNGKQPTTFRDGVPLVPQHIVFAPPTVDARNSRPPPQSNRVYVKLPGATEKDLTLSSTMRLHAGCPAGASQCGVHSEADMTPDSPWSPHMNESRVRSQDTNAPSTLHRQIPTQGGGGLRHIPIWLREQCTNLVWRSTAPAEKRISVRTHEPQPRLVKRDKRRTFRERRWLTEKEASEKRNGKRVGDKTHQLICALRCHGGYGCVDIIGLHIPAVHETDLHELPVARTRAPRQTWWSPPPTRVGRLSLLR